MVMACSTANMAAWLMTSAETGGAAAGARAGTLRRAISHVKAAFGSHWGTRSVNKPVISVEIAGFASEGPTRAQAESMLQLFDEEIRKSWEEYAEQVGKDVADSTPYFKEALNEILAGGRQIF